MWLDYEFESYFKSIGDYENAKKFEKEESEGEDYGEDEG